MEKTFFHHIPKTGGTAFGELLKAECFPNLIDSGWDEGSIIQRLGETRCDFYSGHVGFDFIRLFFREFRVVTFLRDPLSRLWSQFKNWHDPEGHQAHWITDPAIKAAMAGVVQGDFRDFLINPNPIVAGSVSNVLVRFLTAGGINRKPFSPGEYSEILVEEAFYNLHAHYAAYGLLEYLDLSLIDICSALNIAPKQFMEVKNAREEKRFDATHPDWELATQLNLMDIELYRRCREHFLGRLQPTIEAAAAQCVEGYSLFDGISVGDHPVFGDYWSYIEPALTGLWFRWTTGPAKVYLPPQAFRFAEICAYGQISQEFAASGRVLLNGEAMYLVDVRESSFGSVLVYEKRSSWDFGGACSELAIDFPCQRTVESAREIGFPLLKIFFRP